MSRAPRLGIAVIAIPMAALVVLIAATISVALVFGQSSRCGGESAGSVKGAPKKLMPIYEAAAAHYKLGGEGPSILAAINSIESAFGTNMGPSSAGALGWMQFMPETWATWGVDGDGDGDKDPYDPTDAIFSAANYLRDSGAPDSWHDAIFAYNHAEWYVEDVLEEAKHYGAAGNFQSAGTPAPTCSAGVPGGAVLDHSLRLFSPRAFKPLPARLWVGGGAPQSVDARIWPDAVWLLESYGLRVTAARESGHETHGDGTAMDMVPAAGRGWDETALRAALDLGWIPSCGWNGAAPVCPLVPAIQFVGYNGYPGHGDPAHTSSAHLHVSWKSSEYGCPGLCEPREWVEVFPWVG